MQNTIANCRSALRWATHYAVGALPVLQLLTVAACTTAEQTPALNDPSATGVVAIRDTVASCATCVIEMTKLVSLGSNTDSVLLFRTPVIARDSRGRTIAAVKDNGFQPVLVYGPDGAVERTLGRQGSGPGEHTRVEAIAITPGDSILLAHSYLRFSVFAPDGRYARGGSLPTPPNAIIPVPGGGLIINGTLQNQQRRGLPLHQLATDGSLIRSFGTDDIFGSGLSERTLAPRLIGTSFWLSERGQYRLEQVDTLGQVSRVITVATPWWFVFGTPLEVQAYFDTVRPPEEMSASADRYPPRLSYRPAFAIASVVPDGAGRLWVAHHTHVENWDTLDAEYETGTSEVRLADEMKGRMYRTVLDVIDTKRGTLLARRIIPGYGWVANDGTFIHMQYREDGIVSMDVLTLRLQGPR